MWCPCRLKNLLLITLAAFALSLSSVAQVGTCTTADCWSYSGNTNPAYWSGLTPYAYCNQSNNLTQQQSPIDVMPAPNTYPEPVENTNLTLSTNYSNVAVPVEDLNYTIEADYGAGSSQNSVTFNGVTYNLLQFHFHEPSEHAMNQQANGLFAMEVHLVHQAVDKNGKTDPNGAKLVIGIFINAPTTGGTNAALGTMMTAANNHDHSPQNLNPLQIIPGQQNTSSLNYFTYPGSLTTPPCTPGITWVVLATPITVSRDQYTSYVNQYKYSSRNPLAPLPTLNLQSNFNCAYCSSATPKPR